jgi:heat shock transcription factor
MQQQQQQPYGTAQPDQLLRWNGGAMEGNPYAEAAARNGAVNPFGMLSPAAGQYSQGMQNPTSTTLARRGMNSALVPTVPRPSPFESSSESWSNFGDDGYLPLQPQQLQQPPTGGAVDDNDSIEALEERALKAKKEAMNKRKQIPPFVQKLSR